MCVRVRARACIQQQKKPASATSRTYSIQLAARDLHGIVTPVVEHWLGREIAGCTRWDRSDDSLYHERTLYHCCLSGRIQLKLK